MMQKNSGNHDFEFPMASSQLTWINVAISLTFVLFDIGVSRVFRLGIGLSLLIAGLRCVGQLALVATVLHMVFETKSPLAIFLICCAFFLLFIQASESKWTPSHIFFFLVSSHVEFFGNF